MKARQARFRGKDGLELAADVAGPESAPVVMLLHGGGQTRHSWSGAMRALAGRGYRVVNLDARGHGDSAWSPEGDYSLPSLAADLQCVIDALGSLPVLVGASMGGATSLYLAGHSERPVARALVMVDVVPRINREGADRIKAFMSANPQGFATLDEAADAVAAYNPHRPRPRDPEGLARNLRRRADGRWYWHWDPKFLQSPLRIEPPVALAQLLEATSRITLPTLLVRGMQSDIVDDAGVADFQERLPQLEVFNVGGAGHMVAGDRNDAFNEGVFRFLDRHVPLLRG